MERQVLMIKEMPFFKTFRSNGEAVIDTDIFEQWIRMFQNADALENKNRFNSKINMLKQAVSDDLFLNDLSEISSDFRNIDSEAW